MLVRAAGAAATPLPVVSGGSVAAGEVATAAGLTALHPPTAPTRDTNP